MNNRDVAHAWAHQNRDRANGSNFYFEGDTIYSYGRHFPIARIDAAEQTVWFTMDGYSSTTAKHKSIARQAIPSRYRVALVPDPLSPSSGIRYYREQFEALAGRRHTEKWAADFGLLSRQYQTFRECCNGVPGLDPVNFDALTELFNRVGADVAEFWRLRDATAADRAKAAKKRAEKARERLAEKVAQFHAGEVGPSTEFKKVLGCDLLRVYRGEVQTSQGVTFSVNDAKSFWEYFGHVVRGALNFDSYTDGQGLVFSFGQFRLGRIVGGTIYAGCHKIERSEVIRFAGSLGLDTTTETGGNN